MRGSSVTRISRLLLCGFVALSVAAPVHAIDCVKKTVNRTGEPQEEQLVLLFGPEQSEEQLLGEPFRQFQELFLGGLELDTMLRFFDAEVQGRVIPSTDDLNPLLESVCRTGFSVADHEFFILDWSWARWVRDANGTPLGLVPTQPVADPSFRFEANRENRTVRMTLRNDTNRTVMILNGRCSVGTDLDLTGDVTDFLHPGGVQGPDSQRPGPREFSSPDPRSFPGEQVVMTIPDFVLPPFSNGNVEFPVGIRSFDVPVPGTSASMTLIFRGTLFREADRGRRNPVSLAVWDQPFKTYAPRLYNAQAAGGSHVPGYANVYVYLDSRDPDSSIPQLSVEGISPLDGSRSGDVVFNPATDVVKTVVTDRMGRRIARIRVHALLKRDDCNLRYFRYRFKAVDGQGEVARRDVTLWVNPGT